MCDKVEDFKYLSASLSAYDWAKVTGILLNKAKKSFFRWQNVSDPNSSVKKH